MGSSNDVEIARRSFIRVFGGTLGASCLALNWTEIAAAASHAAVTNAAGGTRTTSFLSPAEAAEVEAIAAQIIPTDSTPGAREAGVLWFIDRALTTFYASQAGAFRAGLTEFSSAVRTWRPDASSYAALPSAQQVEFLHTVDHAPFFESVRLLTIVGMFSMPAYGGNRHGVGWELLGFEDLHVFQPPFGYYDRDYPGFVVEPPKST